MDSPSDVQIPKLRCSPFHQSLAADPIGSAACYDAFLCVEVPLPWQRDISMHEPFASMCEAPSAAISGADGRRWRPQGLVPQDSVPQGLVPDPDAQVESGETARVQVTAWEPLMSDGAETGVGPMRRTDWRLDSGRVNDLARALVDGSPGVLVPFESNLVTISAQAFYLCTHGQRDVCCGSMGMDLLTRLSGRGPSELDFTQNSPEVITGADVELRRCSHTGGHRFAATGISMPDGYAWAHLDVDVVRAVTQRSVHPSELAFHCRGSSLIPAGPSQVADRYGLCEVGWDWADARRSVELLGFERRTMATDLRITGFLADGERRAFEVRVAVAAHVPQITCGVIAEPEYKVEPVWMVEGAREVAAVPQ